MTLYEQLREREILSVILADEPSPDDGYGHFVLLTPEERTSVLALIEAARRGKLAWENAMAQVVPGKDPWTLEFATQESLDLIAALTPFEEQV